VSPGADRLRLFVAIYPPADAAAALLGALRGIGLARHRETPVAQVHMTLQFIGDRAAREVDSVAESVERSCAGVGAFTLLPLRIVTLPANAHPRLAAAETDAPARLLEVQRRLAHRLAREPRSDAADRFLPHLTLCRFAHGERQRRLALPIEAPRFLVDRVALVRSVLKPEGARHAEVAAFPLGA
jgi:2'-5' RNA ligase